MTAVSGGLISTTFTYDPNGNQTSGLGRTISYSSYNKPASITLDARTISFLDDADHQRFKQVTPEGATLYISAFGVLAELSSPGASGQKWTDYLSVGGAKVGMRVLQTAAATVSARYFHGDHLGSISVISNENGVVQERLSYDAWGKRRFPNGADDPTGSIASQTTRGFTGEEELSVSGLVHLNGRVYDPLLARMTSADPVVPGAMNAQSWNRYSYVGNQALKEVDPTGYDPVQVIITCNTCGPDFGSGGSDLPGGYGYGVPSYPSLSAQVSNLVNQIVNAPLPVIPNLQSSLPPLPGLIMDPNALAMQAWALNNYAAQLAAAQAQASPAQLAASQAQLAASQAQLAAARAQLAAEQARLAAAKAIAQGSATNSNAYGYVNNVARWGADVTYASADLPEDGTPEEVPLDEAARDHHFKPLTIGPHAGNSLVTSPGQTRGAALLGGFGRPPSFTPTGAGRSGAFNAAKELNGIPRSQQPSATGPNYDRRGDVQPGRSYTFTVPAEGGGSKDIIIRDDAAGHFYGPNDPQNRGPHFNDPPGRHFDY